MKVVFYKCGACEVTVTKPFYEVAKTCEPNTILVEGDHSCINGTCLSQVCYKLLIKYNGSLKVRRLE